MPTGSNGWVSAYLEQSKGRAGAYLTFGKGPTGERILAALATDKEEINSALGLPVEWTRTSDGRGSVVAAKSFHGNLMEDSREATQAWLVDVVQRLISVFRPRIEALLREAT
jgi:surface antigen